MPPPLVAYLRVYEPLSSFDAPLRDLLKGVLETGPLKRVDVGKREREIWLKSQLRDTGVVLPGELADGRPAPSAIRDVLVLNSADIPVEDATVGPGPLVCPLDMRARSAAALVGFLATSSPTLRNAVLPGTIDAARQKAARVLADLPSGAVHVVSTTWTVPLPWFSLVDPEKRIIVVADRDDPARQVCWRVAMGDARRRVERAHTLAEQTFGSAGPTAVLHDTARWLEHFHEHSAVELDYGGLVQLLDDEELIEDTSAEDVHAILTAIEDSEPGEVAARFERLRDFWGDLAIRERWN